MSKEERQKKEDDSFLSHLKMAAYRAAGGGVPGAMAMAIQVLALMWLRTTMNYQYRHGTTTVEAMKTLYKQGGIIRFYRGLMPALLQAPLSRFGDTAANSGMLALLDSFEETKNLNIAIKTLCASVAAGLFRIFLMPIDTFKTIMQVEGKQGLSILGQKFRKNGIATFYYGSIGAAAATFVGHYPWFYTFNFLEENIPRFDGFWQKLGRRALIGFCASVTSDTISNSLRVLKTYRQTHHEKVSYYQAFRRVIKEDGVIGLLGRGLKTRIIANGLQGCLFTVLWKGMEDMLVKRYNLK